MKKTHAHLQTCIKTCVKFQKEQPETVKGIVLTRYLIHMHINSVRDKKKSKLKMQKLVKKNDFRIMIRPHAHL